MIRLTASKDEIKGLPPMPEGLYSVRLDGFKPKYSKDKQSVNLNPQLKVVNHADFNDRRAFENLNSKGKWVWTDFCHAFGIALPPTGADGDVEFPGQWNGEENDPEKWEYVGPLTGQVGQLYLIQAKDNNNNDVNRIKYYICRVPGCAEKHSKNLAG